MMFFTCVLAILLPGLILADTEVCPNRSAIENLDCNSYKGRWYPLMRTGQPDETKCQQQIIEGEGVESAATFFKFAYLNDTAMSYEGTLYKPGTQGNLRLSIPNLLQGDESTYTILATDYHNYAVIDMCWKFNDNHKKNYVSVLSRSTSLSPEARAAVDIALETHHINPDQMVVHYSHEGCPSEHY